jgi:hypothetical protein
MNLSTADIRNYRTEFHEIWWSYRYMFLVDPKVFRFVVEGNSGHWNRTMLNLCGIVGSILKMATGRNFSISGIVSGHHNLPTYEIFKLADTIPQKFKVAFNLFFKPVVSGRFGRLHNR